MRKWILVCLFLLVLPGCAPETLPAEESDWRNETPSWQMVSTDPKDYGISYDDFSNLEGWPLDKLVAYCLGADGIYAEEGFDQLYHYFMEAPCTCVTYFALIQDEAQRDILCSHIAAADVYWYEGTQEFQEILTKLAEVYPGGTEGDIVQSIRNEGN